MLLLASATGQLEPSLTVSEVPWAVTIVDMLGMLLYAVLALRLAKRMGLDRVTACQPAAAGRTCARPIRHPARPAPSPWGPPSGFGPSERSG